MISIKKVSKSNNLILIICVPLFILCNVLMYLLLVWNDNRLLQEYQRINEIALVNNQRKTDFKLYCKSHEETYLQNYYDDCRILNRQLNDLSDEMQNDNNCKMMYRIVCQVIEHSQKEIETYVNSEELYNTGFVTYLDDVDLELERCLNQLTNYYLNYLNQIFLHLGSRLKKMMFVTNLLLILGCISLYRVNRKINKELLSSVDKLSEAAIEIMNKNFDAPDIKKGNFVEFNQVSDTFELMKHAIKHMIVELEETHKMKEHLAEAKIRELQMQMNPHFLFNSLNFVVRNIQAGEREISIKLIKAISKILRSSIEIKEMAIPLDEEIDLLQSYLYIQKLHLKGRITFYMDVRKSFVEDKYKIPPLTIQPLVENSIKHGLKDKSDDGKVEITITEKADYMEIIVADNGVGFSEEVKDEIQRDRKTSIGLDNVKERMRLYYHRDDVMRIERENGITKIILKLYQT